MRRKRKQKEQKGKKHSHELGHLHRVVSTSNGAGDPTVPPRKQPLPRCPRVKTVRFILLLPTPYSFPNLPLNIWILSGEEKKYLSFVRLGANFHDALHCIHCRQRENKFLHSCFAPFCHLPNKKPSEGWYSSTHVCHPRPQTPTYLPRHTDATPPQQQNLPHLLMITATFHSQQSFYRAGRSRTWPVPSTAVWIYGKIVSCRRFLGGCLCWHSHALTGERGEKQWPCSTKRLGADKTAWPGSWLEKFQTHQTTSGQATTTTNIPNVENLLPNLRRKKKKKKKAYTYKNQRKKDWERGRQRQRQRDRDRD